MKDVRQRMSEWPVFMRRGRVLRETGLSDWMVRRLESEGTLPSFAMTRAGLVPWERASDAERLRVKRIYRSMDVRRIMEMGLMGETYADLAAKRKLEERMKVEV